MKIVFIIIVLILFIVLILLTYYTVIRNIRKKSLQNFNDDVRELKSKDSKDAERMQKLELTDYEESIIRPICTETFFPFYFFYCKSNYIWDDLKQRLSINEKIYNIAVMDIYIIPGYSNIKGISHLFYSIDNNYYLYNQDKFILKLKPSDIAEIDYNLYEYFLDLGTGLFSKMKIVTFDGLTIASDSIYSRNVELIIDAYLEYRKNNLLPVDDKALNLSSVDRQTIKLNQIKDNNQITENEHRILLPKVHITHVEANKQLFDRALNESGR
jgi:hypothetical protein